MPFEFSIRRSAYETFHVSTRFPQNNREKLVVPRRRYVHILGHIAEANVTFRGKGGTAEHVTDFHFENRNGAQLVLTP